jgi:hypothetical protein
VPLPFLSPSGLGGAPHFSSLPKGCSESLGESTRVMHLGWSCGSSVVVISFRPRPSQDLEGERGSWASLSISSMGRPRLVSRSYDHLGAELPSPTLRSQLALLCSDSRTAEPCNMTIPFSCPVRWRIGSLS